MNIGDDKKIGTFNVKAFKKHSLPAVLCIGYEVMASEHESECVGEWGRVRSLCCSCLLGLPWYATSDLAINTSMHASASR